MYVEGKVGYQALANGVFSQPSLGKGGEILTADVHSRLYSPNYQGRLFVASTAVAGVAGQQATTLAATCALAICNPTTSVINAVLVRLAIGYMSGTTGVCTYHWTQYKAQGNTAASGTAMTATALNGSATTATCTVGTGTSVTAGAPTVMLRNTGISTQAQTASVTTIETQMVDNIDGALIVPPGQAYVLFGVGAAGSSEKLQFTLEWEEVPV